MPNVRTTIEQEVERREAAVIEAARRFAATRSAYLNGMDFDALFEGYKAARDALFVAVASLEELIGPLQEQQQP